MNLEILSKRLQEIDQTIAALNSQLHVLQGHKTEVNHWISQLKEAPDETKVDQPLVNSLDNAVE